jgi:hypothetical protein
MADARWPRRRGGNSVAAPRFGGDARETLHRDTGQPPNPPRQGSPRQQLAIALRRSADTHDQAAILLDKQGRPERAAWHRTAAAINRARADKLDQDPPPL